MRTLLQSVGVPRGWRVVQTRDDGDGFTYVFLERPGWRYVLACLRTMDVRFFCEQGGYYCLTSYGTHTLCFGFTGKRKFDYVWL